MLSDTTPTVVPTTLPESPYRGIEPFRYIDQPIFFAREEETRKLLRLVAVYRGVLFYGGSGCGKSSLINAGFIPVAITEGFTPERLRLQPKAGEEIIVERISTKDSGQAPYLPSNLVVTQGAGARIVMSCEELKERLRNLPRGQRPLLIFDQFEEFATLFEEVPRGEAVSQAQKAQQAILKLIVELQRDPTLPVKLLFSFREDYLAKLNKLIAQSPDLSDQYLRLTPPGTDSLHDIIRGSFEKYPQRFARELSEDLTVKLAAAIEARNEGGKLNLSEVQIACLELWKSDNPDELFKEKDVRGLLEDYLSDSLNRLSENLREPAVALLSRMVTPSGARNIVSEYDLISQVHEDESIAEDRLKAALHALVQETKLVRREPRYDTYFYDIVSEFLIPWISRQKAARLTAIQRRKLEAAERGRRGRAYKLALVSVLVTIIVGLGSFVLIRERNRTIAERNNTIELERQAAYLRALQDRLVSEARNDAAEQAREAYMARQEAASLQAQTTRLTTQLNDATKKLETTRKESETRWSQVIEYASQVGTCKGDIVKRDRHIQELELRLMRCK